MYKITSITLPIWIVCGLRESVSYDVLASNGPRLQRHLAVVYVLLLHVQFVMAQEFGSNHDFIEVLLNAMRGGGARGRRPSVLFVHLRLIRHFCLGCYGDARVQ